MSKSIICQNLTASFNKKIILNKVSFELKKGDFIALCGKNGSGKSTLFSVLAGVQDKKLNLEHSENVPVIKDGEKIIKICKISRKECAKQISYMIQSEQCMWDFSVFDFVLSGRFAYTVCGNYSIEDKLAVEDALSILEISDFKDRNVNSLSGGEFQKVRIARSLCQQSDFILLDEPFSSLDFVIQPKIIEQLKWIAKEKNIGVLISIHDLNLAARYSDKMLLLGKNSIFGETKEVFNSENLSSTFETPLQVYNHPIFNSLCCDIQVQ